MRKKSLLYTGLGLVASLWLLNFIALTFYLYWTLEWYDYLMHFLGGLTLGVLVIWAFKVENRSWKSFITVIACVMLIGGAWEVFEYINDIAAVAGEYWADTSQDLLMDILGIIVAYVFSTSTSRPQEFS